MAEAAVLILGFVGGEHHEIVVLEIERGWQAGGGKPLELVGQGGHAVEFDALEGGGFGFGGQIGMGGYVPPPVFGVGGFGGCGFAQHLVGVDEAAARGEQAGDLAEQGLFLRVVEVVDGEGGDDEVEAVFR